MQQTARILGLVAILGGATPAFAKMTDAQKEEALLKKAKLSLAEAIATAEKHQNGRAVSADLDQKIGKTVYEIDVVAGGKLFDVAVDAETGAVLSSVEDVE